MGDTSLAPRCSSALTWRKNPQIPDFIDVAVLDKELYEGYKPNYDCPFYDFYYLCNKNFLFCFNDSGKIRWQGMCTSVCFLGKHKKCAGFDCETYESYDDYATGGCFIPPKYKE